MLGFRVEGFGFRLKFFSTLIGVILRGAFVPTYFHESYMYAARAATLCYQREKGYHQQGS